MRKREGKKYRRDEGENGLSSLWGGRGGEDHRRKGGRKKSIDRKHFYVRGGNRGGRVRDAISRRGGRSEATTGVRGSTYYLERRGRK